jgi:hypothetical protein
VVHFELPADDVERASAFYREAFGWTLTAMTGMDYTLATTADTDAEGRPTEPGTINGGVSARREPITAPVITLRVDDIDAALARVEQLGGKTVQSRQAVADMGFTGYFSDSEGNVVGLWQDA